MSYGDDPEDWLFDDDDTPNPMDEFEQAVQDCGLDAAGINCDLAGTEFCDFHCIFRKS